MTYTPRLQEHPGLAPANNKGSPSSVRARLDFPLVALLLCLGALVAVEVLLGPQRRPSGDNAWPFRWALDLARGGPIYWSGVDGNRTFPDLLFSFIAALLPGGDRYDRWLDYYYAILTLSIWASLLMLATVLYPDKERRFAFVSLASALLLGIAVVFPFWDTWIMAPGNHGGSIPAVLIVISIFLLDARRNRYGTLLTALYILMCAGLVMANRYLALIVIIPLFMCGLIVRQTWFDKVLASAETCLAASLGFVAFYALNTSHFFRLVAAGHHPPFEDATSMAWWFGRFYKELDQIGSVTNKAQILAGVVIIALAIAYGTSRLIASKLAGNKLAGKMDAQAALAVFVAASGLISFLFVLVIVDDQGDWHYRYLTVPLTISMFALAAAAIRIPSSMRRACLVAPFVMLVPATYILLSGSSNYAAAADYEKSFRQDVDRLSIVLMQHDHRTVHSGLANYWIANEVTARAPNIRLLSVGNGLVYRPYNNNAAELCHADVSFVLVYAPLDEPNGDPRVDLSVFPPQTSTSLKLGRFGIVKVLFYDSGVLDDRVVKPALAAARREFPSFSCKR